MVGERFEQPIGGVIDMQSWHALDKSIYFLIHVAYVQPTGGGPSTTSSLPLAWDKPSIPNSLVPT